MSKQSLNLQMPNQGALDQGWNKKAPTARLKAIARDPITSATYTSSLTQRSSKTDDYQSLFAHQERV